MTTLAGLADLAEQPPRSLWCRLGFHRMVRIDWLITTGHSACVKCGEVWICSMFGDFDLPRHEGAAFLRKAASDIADAPKPPEDI